MSSFGEMMMHTAQGKAELDDIRVVEAGIESDSIGTDMTIIAEMIEEVRVRLLAVQERVAAEVGPLALTNKLTAFKAHEHFMQAASQSLKPEADDLLGASQAVVNATLDGEDAAKLLDDRVEAVLASLTSTSEVMALGVGAARVVDEGAAKLGRTVPVAYQSADKYIQTL